MQKILIPTDFSQNAKRATDYALSLFDSKDLSVTLFYVSYIPYGTADVAYSVNDIIYNNSKELFKTEQHRINEKFPNLKCSITTHFSIGDVVGEACELESEEKFDLIVMGTKGASGLAEVFVGSRTSAMIRSVKTPVLAIPEAAEFTIPKRILFAANEELIDQTVNLDVLKEIAIQNHSKIDALYISKNDENKEIIEKFLAYEIDLNFVDIPHDLKMKHGNNVEEALKGYTENNSIDLVAMITTNGKLFHNIFHESITKRVAMHTKTPLLVMHNDAKAH